MLCSACVRTCARPHVRMCMHGRFRNGLLLAIALMSFAIWCRRQCSGHVGRGVQVRRVRWRCSSVVRLFAERESERWFRIYLGAKRWWHVWEYSNKKQWLHCRYLSSTRNMRMLSVTLKVTAIIAYLSYCYFICNVSLFVVATTTTKKQSAMGACVKSWCSL